MRANLATIIEKALDRASEAESRAHEGDGATDEIATTKADGEPRASAARVHVEAEPDM